MSGLQPRLRIMQPVTFRKGHGAGNDFVLLPEPIAELDAATVALLCDRHFGVGANGLVQPIREGNHWFMDYRNADGSLAQTCGNGIRVFARHLVETGLEQRGTFTVGTRGGDVRVTVREDDADFRDVAVVMGRATGLDEPCVEIVTETGTFLGSRAYMPNPHCVCIVSDIDSAGNLHNKPDVRPATAFPEGVNVEFIERVTDVHIRMRTYERGVGETLACGSGACAAAAVWARHVELPSSWTVQVDVLGGTLFVDCNDAGELTLRGPATFVADGEFTA